MTEQPNQLIQPKSASMLSKVVSPMGAGSKEKTIGEKSQRKEPGY